LATRLTIAAVGRLKAGPERELAERYLDRAVKAGARLGLSIGVHEVPESRAASSDTRKREEAAALLGALPGSATLIALDEGGGSLTSRVFAERLAAWRDTGVEQIGFFIGGPDGLDGGLLKAATLRLAFGAMTWPHQLVRLLLAEQIYRATTILSGHPYHRG
jgi:23S rRNA (pseudouridine1915-N3)-methyltransferase